MDNVCKICEKKCKDATSLHRHFKAHSISMAKYYQTYFPRYDKYDGSMIRFKNFDFYMSADFNSRSNLKNWLLQVSKDEAKSYLRGFLQARKQRKSLRFAPSQVELRSLPIAGMVYLNEVFGDYYRVCKELGFELKFSKLGWSKAPKRFNARHHILCDTREQQPLSFPTLIRNYEALKFGDYRLNDDDFTHHCCIERKALNDFYTTITSGYARFIKEVERAQEAGFYLVVLIESPFSSIYSFATNVLEPMQIYIKPEHVFHNMREMCQKYPNLQFLFVHDRDEASRAVERIFQSDGEYKEVDLQYLYDSGQLF